jgi:hypothetical protein
MKTAMPETAGWVRLRSKENIWLLNVSGPKANAPAELCQQQNLAALANPALSFPSWRLLRKIECADI